MKDTFRTGLKRPLIEEDIFEVTNSLKSDKNTKEFADLWEEELKKPSPSVLRVMLKLHGFNVIFWGFVFSVFDTIAR